MDGSFAGLPGRGACLGHARGPLPRSGCVHLLKCWPHSGKHARQGQRWTVTEGTLSLFSAPAGSCLPAHSSPRRPPRLMAEIVQHACGDARVLRVSGTRTWDAALRMCCSMGRPSCRHAAPPGGACGGRNTPLQACIPGPCHGLGLSADTVWAWLPWEEGNQGPATTRVRVKHLVRASTDAPHAT